MSLIMPGTLPKSSSIPKKKQGVSVSKKVKPTRSTATKPSRPRKPRAKKADNFYDSPEWLALRYQILKEQGRRCVVCGAVPPDVVIHVDHIKPRSLRPDLELDKTNLQVMCADCNRGKSNKDSIDWREKDNWIDRTLGPDDPPWGKE